MCCRLLYKLINVVILISFICVSCSEKIDNRPHLTVVTSISGLGDMGYNDKIIAGVMNFYEQHDVRMNLLSPKSEDEVKEIISNWQSQTANERLSLLLLADSQYEKVLRSLNPKLTSSQKILLFESKSTDLPSGIHTFYINRYGVCYLAGCMAREHKSATIIAAMPGNLLLEEAIEGFTQAYNKEVEIIFLAENLSGFSSPDKAFITTGKIIDSFILPLAGGSNIGIYKYSRETPLYTSLIVGMDTDCSLFSTRIPFSVVINIDQIVERYLSEWFENVSWGKTNTYGLNDDATDIIISAVFYQRMEIWDNYYDSPDYWFKTYVKYVEEAKEKEVKYE